MPWGKVDDKLHSHIKWRRATKGARSLWTTALSWCSDHPTGGKVPRDILGYLDGTAAEARCLVSVGLWDVTDDGWLFHDWDERNPDSETVKASRTAKSTGGVHGNHTRWHVKRGIKVPDCPFCDEDE